MPFNGAILKLGKAAKKRGIKLRQSYHRMGRCYLKGLKGDAFNAILAAAASNFRKLYRLVASCADLAAMIEQMSEVCCVIGE